MTTLSNAPANRYVTRGLVVLCILVVTVLSEETANSSSRSSKSATATTTFPLVPHHVQRTRRERERQRSLLAAGLGDTSVTSTTAERSSSFHSDVVLPHSIRRRATAQQVGALYQGYGTHYIDLWCGTPPQRQTVIVDTGSGITAFPCSGCKDCGVPKYHVDQLFDEDASSTFRSYDCDNGCISSRSRCSDGQCKLSMAYAEGSRWDAHEVVDNCYVGGPHEQPLVVDDGGTDDMDPLHAKNFAFDLIFGCQTYLTGLFKTQLADGIMGMDYRAESFWNQMFKAGKMGNEKKFSLCFSRSPTVDRIGTEAGAVTLGGVDERFDLSPMVYTPNASKGRSGFFNVQVRRLWLRDGSGGESAKSTHDNPKEGITAVALTETELNKGGIIVDSGTTDTYWNLGISRVFRQAFLEVAGRTHTNTEISLSAEELHALPTILFQLVSDEDSNPGMDPYNTLGLAGALDPDHPNDVILAFPPSHYMEFDPDKGKYTSRFYLTESSGSVLGANAMMGHNVLFDTEADQLGWSESHCDYTKLVTDNGYDFAISGHLQTAPPVDNNKNSDNDPPEESPTEPPVDPPVPESSPTVPLPSATAASSESKGNNNAANDDDDDDTQAEITVDGSSNILYTKFVDVCETQTCQQTVLVATVFGIFLCCFLSYKCSCCCTSKVSSTPETYVYSKAAANELEMAEGDFSTTYRDDPEKDDDGTPSEKSTPTTASTTKTNGFQDEPRTTNGTSSRGKPEFHGDFI